MDKEYLEDYLKREIEEWEKYLKRFRKNGRVYQNFPSLIRFNKYNRPMAFSTPFKPPWVQIPLYGTTIIPLVPVLSSEEFSFSHGFDVEDIPRMVDLAKRTGKIQFVLAQDPPLYEKMEYIDPIFIELEPPKLTIFSITDILNPSEVTDRYTQFLKMSKQGLIQLLYRELIYEIQDLQNFHHQLIEKIMSNIFDVYEHIRLFGHYDLIDLLNELFIKDPFLARYYISILNRIYVGPKRKLFEATICESYDLYQSDVSVLSKLSLQPKTDIIFPFEIGWFLNNELNLIYPKNVDGAIELNDLYDSYDLNRLMLSLWDAMKNKNGEDIDKNEKEIYELLSQTWDEADKLIKNKYVDLVVSLLIALIGEGIPIYKGKNILKTLGWETLDDKIREIFLEKGQTIFNHFKDEQIMNIYKFKKKYKK